MFGISPTLMIALGVLTVAALFLMTPLGKRKRKRPEEVGEGRDHAATSGAL